MRRGSSVNATPSDLSCRVIRSGKNKVVLLSFTPAARPLLTEAERDIALAVSHGLSNAQIASARGSSPRTIANQMAAIMRKLGVSSRVELAVHFGASDFI
jgi:DNA-binding NarL/FixJ family response regulator